MLFIIQIHRVGRYLIFVFWNFLHYFYKWSIGIHLHVTFKLCGSRVRKAMVNLNHFHFILCEILMDIVDLVYIIQGCIHSLATFHVLFKMISQFLTFFHWASGIKTQIILTQIEGWNRQSPGQILLTSTWNDYVALLVDRNFIWLLNHWQVA